MTRKQIYSKLYLLNIQEEAKKKYGKNFTQCTNEQLISLINKAENIITQKTKSKSYENSSIVITDDSFKKLVDILAKKRILLDSEVKEIYNN